MITYSAIILFCIAPTICSNVPIETDSLLKCEYVLAEGLAYAEAEDYYVVADDCVKWIDGKKP
jgi:hypothetical protein